MRFLQSSSGVDAIVVAADGELELKDVIRLAEEDLLRAISGWFETVDDHVERVALQRGDECFPVARHKLRAPAHRLGQRVDHLFFVADVTIGIGGIGEDVRRATARIGAPTEHLLRHNRIAAKAATKRHKKHLKISFNSFVHFMPFCGKDSFVLPGGKLGEILAVEGF